MAAGAPALRCRTPAGRLLLTSGCGGMSGAQPLAGKLAGASTLVIEVDQARIDRRIASGYCDATTGDLDDAIAQWHAARDARRPLASGSALREFRGGAAGIGQARHRP